MFENRSRHWFQLLLHSDCLTVSDGGAGIARYGEVAGGCAGNGESTSDQRYRSTV